MHRLYRLEWRSRDGQLLSFSYARLEDIVRLGLKVRHIFGNAEIVDSITGEPVEL